MVDFIEFFRFFNLSILGGGSKWSILLNTSRPRGEGLNSRFNCFFFYFLTWRGGSRWSILLNFSDFLTFRPRGEGLNGRFN